ncbi:MAG: hypothetical protein FWG98_04730 [Candidatus Cloacimonetes bacterium]|nr:hypothetical protein [Candidatus Cloacimonadota bacterium]
MKKVILFIALILCICYPVFAEIDADKLEKAVEDAIYYAFEAVPARSRIAIVQVSARDRNVRDFVQGALEVELMRHENRYIVAERRQMDQIMSERQITVGTEIDENTAIAIARQANAGIALTAQVTGEGSLRRLRLRVLNVQEGILVGAAAEPF